jgi:hypothetical protein
VARAPRYWTPLAASFPDDPKPSALLAEFGAPGPYVFVVILCTATAQSYAGGAKGQARMGWPALANKASIDVEAAEEIVRRIAELGEIDLLAHSEYGFTAALCDWELWMPKDLTAAGRQARSRAKHV